MALPLIFVVPRIGDVPTGISDVSNTTSNLVAVSFVSDIIAQKHQTSLNPTSSTVLPHTGPRDTLFAVITESAARCFDDRGGVGCVSISIKISSL